jgi:hypothetical protein
VGDLLIFFGKSSLRHTPLRGERKGEARRLAEGLEVVRRPHHQDPNEALPEIPTEVTHIPGDQVGGSSCGGTAQDRPIFLGQIDFPSKFRREHHRLTDFNSFQKFIESDPLLFFGQVPPGFFNGIS